MRNPKLKSVHVNREKNFKEIVEKITSMLENTESTETEKEKRKYIEIVIRQYRPLVFGVLSTLCLILASLEIVAGIFFVFSLAFLMATIITIITAQKGNTRKLRLI